MTLGSDAMEGEVMSTNVSARAEFLLNRMNSIASDSQLGSLLVAIDDAQAIAADEVVTASILNGAVTKAKLAAGISASLMVVLSGTFTTLGGDANEAITATGAVAGDLVLMNIKTAGGTPRSIVSAVAATNAVNVVLSGDPSTDHVLQWYVLRATS